MANIVIIGAGVTGLSCALRIQEAGHNVAIVAKDFPSGFETIDAITQINYTSPWGGAHNRFILPPPDAGPDSQEAREHAMALLTWEKMRSLHDEHAEAGITFLKAYDYFEAPEPAQTSLTEYRARAQFGMRGFRFHAKEELPEGVQLGYEYDTWCLNPMVYCAFLLRRFAYRGGKIFKREIRDPLEVFEIKDLSPIDVLINASGIGFGDHDVFITTGQTCLVANTCPVTITRLNAKGMPTFNVPRGFEGGTVIGGTKIPNDWNPNPSLELREKLLSNFATMYPDILGPDGKFTVIKDIVGRRPTRKGGMRLEKEIGQGNRCIIHAYGLGGRGYELSWGVADKVGQLLAAHLGSAGIAASQGQARL
ncbi:putative fad dependent oxidoreductase superfamily protein [Rosellinia necatrix]|uniref:Putative fad dependent oxidoreductase superfamily protein n=1 Tax=Rosellinia necatrix TaxID=77044 RepID=A0A1S7ULQ0_ROSNE|nr:putative fad dependent oxidoreductase superfamily protein [Rosellinia necatrix]